MPPTLFIKNALRLAELGLGDGTIYASGSGATPNVAQKTFAISGLAIIADIGADADDKFNGYLLYFPASGNRYHIVDWVAGTDTATVHENPATGDTGACEIRRALVENKSAAGNPAHRLADGQVFSAWKGSAANQAQNIDVHLPNLLQQGGFEELAAGAFPAFEPKGTWWSTSADWAVSASAALLGSRMAVWTPGGADSSLIQGLSLALKTGRKYRMIFKAQAVTGATNPSAIQVYMENRFTGANIATGFAGGNPWSLGAIGTTAAWYASPDFTVDSDGAAARINIIGRIANKGAATAVRIDEVYLWEQVNVGALAVFGHNWEGMAAGAISGYNCATDRTGLTVAVDYFTLASLQAPGASTYLREFTPAIHPVYRIQLPAFSGTTYEASEILLAQQWTWGGGPDLPFDPARIVFNETRFVSRSGVEHVYRHNSRRKLPLKYSDMTSADLATLINDFYPHHRETLHPFGFQLDSASQPVLYLDQKSEFGTPYEGVKASLEMECLEVVS